MNGYPFAGPGGQKTLHRQSAEQIASMTVDQTYMAVINLLAECITPQQVYAQVMEYDNR